MIDDDGRGIDEALAALRADAADSHAFLQALAVRFEGALPGHVTVDRRHGLLSRDHSVRAVEIDLAEDRFRIGDAGNGALEARRTRVVRGIALKSETLSVDGWIAALSATLATTAQASAGGQEALRRLLLGR